MNKKSFASDNYSGVHPEILENIMLCNNGHVPSYGYDYYCEKAKKIFNNLFSTELDIYFTFNGTGANILGISSLINSYNSIICANTAHINVDECGAPSKLTAASVIAIPNYNGKIKIKDIEPYIELIGVEHHSQPKVISISQCTELGTTYTPKEVKEICNFAHKHNMYVHMDGARIANAAAYLNCDIKEFTINAGVDVISFGGTKNGMMYGEAVIFFNKELSKNTKFIQKQSMQLSSKTRYIAAQFCALLENDLWLNNASHSNKMANLLAHQIKDIPKITITQPVESNAVFAIIPKEYVKKIQKKYFFYVWDYTKSEVRIMCSFDTSEEDINNFVNHIKSILL